jgi:predicted kinase
MSMLYIFGGLPASGKTTLSRHLARELRAVHLRIDSIEQALRDVAGRFNGPEGYVVAQRLAADNLRLGLSVVADSVNPLPITRAA